MICPNCGTANKEGEIFCAVCSFKLPVPVPEPAKTTEPEKQPEKTSEPVTTAQTVENSSPDLKLSAVKPAEITPAVNTPPASAPAPKKEQANDPVSKFIRVFKDILAGKMGMAVKVWTIALIAAVAAVIILTILSIVIFFVKLSMDVTKDVLYEYGYTGIGNSDTGSEAVDADTLQLLVIGGWETSFDGEFYGLVINESGYWFGYESSDDMDEENENFFESGFVKYNDDNTLTLNMTYTEYEYEDYLLIYDSNEQTLTDKTYGDVYTKRF
jgi:uncharacterized Zn finger protein (UPF0148 family)